MALISALEASGFESEVRVLKANEKLNWGKSMKFMLMNFYRIKKRKGKKTSSLTDQGKGIRAESFKNGQDDVMWSELGLSCVFYWWWF